MNKRCDYLEEVADFLGATFHQDMGSPEEALDEFIEECYKEALLTTLKDCEEFLRNDWTNEEKESFIQNKAEIYFPAIGLTPLQWLNKVVEQLRAAVKTK